MAMATGIGDAAGVVSRCRVCNRVVAIIVFVS